MEFIESDGGRAEAGYQGVSADCVIRSIAIAAELPYQKVRDDLNRLSKKIHRVLVGNARSGYYRNVYERYILGLGWTWYPTMFIGKGCRVHMRKDELPSGRLILSVAQHVTCVIDGVIYDQHDPSRDGTRCVYGYYKKNRGGRQMHPPGKSRYPIEKILT
jgi:hypothetical protein